MEDGDSVFPISLGRGGGSFVIVELPKQRFHLLRSSAKARPQDRCANNQWNAEEVLQPSANTFPSANRWRWTPIGSNGRALLFQRTRTRAATEDEKHRHNSNAVQGAPSLPRGATEGVYRSGARVRDHGSVALNSALGCGQSCGKARKYGGSREATPVPPSQTPQTPPNPRRYPRPPTRSTSTSIVSCYLGGDVGSEFKMSSKGE